MGRSKFNFRRKWDFASPNTLITRDDLDDPDIDVVEAVQALFDTMGGNIDVSGKMDKASNLSDVVDVPTSRTSLGLGSAATKNTATSGDASAAQVVKGDDTRLKSDAAVTALAASADAASALRQAFGSKQGVVISPWAPSPTLAGELWTLANFQSGYNTTQLAPSLTANSSNLNKRTRPALGNMANGDTTFRIEFDYDQSTLVGGGWATISLSLSDSSGNLVPGTDVQMVVTNDSPLRAGHYIFDFKPPAVGTIYLDLRIDIYNNCTGGTTTVSNVTLRKTGDVTRPMLVSKEYATGAFPFCYWQQKELKTGLWKVARVQFDDDGNITPAGAFGGIDGFDNESPWNSDPADPAFVRPSVGVTGKPGYQQESGVGSTARSLRVKNNDQIIEVWNGSAYELRGNTHLGEYVRGAGPTYKVDRGAGFVPWTLAHGLIPVRRFQVNSPTEMRRTTDGTTPFCNVDHLYTVYPDGVIRCDRTTTFLSAIQVQAFFEWMSSHNTNSPYIGRIGKGTEPIGEVDTHPKVATPAAPTVTPSATGGTLPAATYSYRVAALSAYGETLASVATTGVTTGSTGSVTVSWAAVPNATGYLVFGRVAGVERFLARVAGLSWLDDNSVVPGTVAPPVASTARLFNGAIAADSIHSTDASWAVWMDLRSGWCYGNIYDRESPLGRAQVANVRTRLEGGGGIEKNYANLAWAGGVDTTTIPAGAVWTATHYSMVYLPYDPINYHREIALRASNLSALATLYPTT